MKEIIKYILIGALSSANAIAYAQKKYNEKNLKPGEIDSDSIDDMLDGSLPDATHTRTGEGRFSVGNAVS